jgi:UDP-N-acetylmuramate: L-alanyl-gamma-D-glutamyl-meso-diaminopimelate ligase
MGRIHLSPPATVHLIGVCGTGMGALAGLLKASGYTVTGSDAHPYPPMSTELAALGIPVFEGYRRENLAARPDLVVVGNVCRKDHPEAAAAREMGLACASMPRTLQDLLLSGKRALVIAGTHGKTTTTSLTAYLLHATGRDPSALIGGVAADFGAGFRLGAGADFVVEGDEYDSAYFEKVPKFLAYAPHAAVVTSVEHDHVDIYPTVEAYTAAFAALVRIVRPGPLAIYAGDPGARAVASKFEGEVITYGVDGDPLPDRARWMASPRGAGALEISIDGASTGVWRTPLSGRHNARNTLAALILAHAASAVPLDDLRAVLPGFGGVARRQQLVGAPRRISVYDDFAHHPTAVRETLAALRERHPGGRLLAAFEPRSATACRSLHQKAYAEAFDLASRVVIAPVGRELPAGDRLDVAALARALVDRGLDAHAAASFDEVVALIASWAEPGDTVALLSNGAFGGLHARIVEALA